jgi:alkylation response protein AidB-like acyl-CoA dehydrogenase
MTQQSFFLGEDQRIFRESLARWLEEHWSLLKRRRQAESDPGYSREAWAGLAEMGVLAAFLPERVGGAGGGGLELMVAMEAFGRALFASPYLWTVALSAPLLALPARPARNFWAGSQRARRSGSVAPEVSALRPSPCRNAPAGGAGYVLSGAKQGVPYGAAADFPVVPARTMTRATGWDFPFFVPAGAKGLALKSFATADGLRAADRAARC